MARIIVNQHIRDGGLTISICDEDILGKKFENEKMELNLASSFYKGEAMDHAKVMTLLNAAKSAIVVGKESISLVQKEFQELEISVIQGVPFATLIKLF